MEKSPRQPKKQEIASENEVLYPYAQQINDSDRLSLRLGFGDKLDDNMLQRDFTSLHHAHIWDAIVADDKVVRTEERLRDFLKWSSGALKKDGKLILEFPDFSELSAEAELIIDLLIQKVDSIVAEYFVGMVVSFEETQGEEAKLKLKWQKKNH